MPLLCGWRSICFKATLAPQSGSLHELPVVSCRFKGYEVHQTREQGNLIQIPKTENKVLRLRRPRAIQWLRCASDKAGCPNLPPTFCLPFDTSRHAPSHVTAPVPLICFAGSTHVHVQRPALRKLSIDFPDHKSTRSRTLRLLRCLHHCHRNYATRPTTRTARRLSVNLRPLTLRQTRQA